MSYRWRIPLYTHFSQILDFQVVFVDFDVQPFFYSNYFFSVNNDYYFNWMFDDWKKEILANKIKNRGKIITENYLKLKKIEFIVRKNPKEFVTQFTWTDQANEWETLIVDRTQRSVLTTTTTYNVYNSRWSRIFFCRFVLILLLLLYPLQFSYKYVNVFFIL